MSYEYKHINNPQRVATGLAQHILISPLHAFQRLQVLEQGKTEIRRNHLFTAGAGWIKIVTAPYKGDLKSEQPESGQGGNIVRNLEVFIQGSYAELHEAIAHLLHEPCIVLVPDFAGDQYYQLGTSLDSAAWISADFATETVLGNAKGYKLTVKAVGNSIVTYTGAAWLQGVNYGGGLLWSDAGADGIMEYAIGAPLNWTE